MPTLPSAASFVGSTVTEAQFKTAQTDLLGFLSGLMGSDGTKKTALETLGSLGAKTSRKTGAYAVLAADRGTVFLCSGTWTLSLTAAATLGDGFTFAVINTGSGVITIDPSGSETVNGALTLALNVGQSCLVTCDGTGFFTISGAGAGGFSSPATSKTGAYTVLADDAGKTVLCSGTWTLSLTAAATLGNGFVFSVKNTGSGVITVDPSGSETVNGALTLALNGGEDCIVVCSGTAFFTISASGTNVQTFTSSGTWTKPPFGSMYRVELVGGGGGGGRGTAAGAGGGGGCYAEKTGPLSTLTATVAVTCGSGGAGRTGSAGPGTSGTATTFGGYLSAPGGGGGAGGTTTTGLSAGTGGGGVQENPGGTGTVGGAGGSSASTTNPVAGVPDSHSRHGAGGLFGGGGGGSGDSTAYMGRGGSSVYGGGGGAGGGNTTIPGGTSVFAGAGGQSQSNATGGAGNYPGGGGAGTATDGYNGGNGAAGRCIVTVW